MIPEQTNTEYKRWLWNVLNSIDRDNCAGLIRAVFDRQVAWHGPHPINDLHGCDQLAEDHYAPLYSAFPDLDRHDDLFLAGSWKGDHWIAAAGHYRGTFASDWLGIPATGTRASLRFGEFYKIDANRIVECFVLFDLPDLYAQAGIGLLPPSLGDVVAVPGPASGDGVLIGTRPDGEAARSMRLVEDMIGDLMRYDPARPDDYEVMRHDRCWHEDMCWYGPSGIGTTRGIAEFIDRQQKPFLKAFPDRKAGHAHASRIADGHYAASTGWPGVVATHSGDGWLGQAASNREIGMRVMDFWCRDGDKLRENWVLIDIVELFLQFGVDLLAQAGNTTTNKIPVSEKYGDSHPN